MRNNADPREGLTSKTVHCFDGGRPEEPSELPAIKKPEGPVGEGTLHAHKPGNAF